MKKEHKEKVANCFIFSYVKNYTGLIFLKTRNTKSGRAASNAHGMFE
jgi:hypothetical protein